MAASNYILCESCDKKLVYIGDDANDTKAFCLMCFESLKAQRDELLHFAKQIAEYSSGLAQTKARKVIAKCRAMKIKKGA